MLCCQIFWVFKKSEKSGFLCELISVSPTGNFFVCFLFGLLGVCKGFGPYSLPAISDLLAASLKLLIFRAEFGENLEKNHSCIAVQIAYGNNFVFCNL